VGEFTGATNDLFFAQYLNATRGFHFLDFSETGSFGWNREKGNIRLNLQMVAGVTSLFPTTANASSPSAVASSSSLLSPHAFPSAALCTAPALGTAVWNNAQLSGLLYHEIGHETFADTFGASSGIGNQWEGQFPFIGTFSVGAGPVPGPAGGVAISGVQPPLPIMVFPKRPLPPIDPTPAVGSGTVTRHWIIEWLGAYLRGYLVDWSVGAAAELEREHVSACAVNSCCTNAPLVGSGYDSTTTVCVNPIVPIVMPTPTCAVVNAALGAGCP